MTHWLQRVRRQRPLVVGVIVFMIAATLAAVLVLHSERRQVALHRAEVAAQALDKAHDLHSVIEHALAASYALAAMVRQGRGEIADFDAVTHAMLPFFPGVAALQLAPGGVITQVVPLAGNGGAIGHDLLADPARNAEAFLARDSGKLTLAGPFELIQGGVGAVGRLPVYLEGAHGESQFWGFVSVLMRFPRVLDGAYLDRLVRQGFRYELWRIHPDTGMRQVIAASSAAPLAEPVEHDFSVPNGTWTLSVEPLGGWRDTALLSLNVVAGLLFSLLLGWLAKQMVQLRAHRSDLQETVAKRTSEVLAREADLNHAQAVAHVGSWLFETADGEVRWSDEAYRMFGVERGLPVDYTRFMACVHPDDRPRVEAAWSAALSGAPYDIEHRVLVDGTVRWVRERAELELDGAGHPVRAVGTVQDITAAHEAAAQLRQLSTAVEYSPASIVITDRHGTIEYVNPHFEQCTGYTFAEAIGQNPRILKSGARSKEEYAALWNTITAGGVWRGEFENVRKDGSRYWELASIAPIRAPDGAISGFVAVKEDITLHKQAERELREREAKLASLIASLPDMMFVIDRARRIVEFHAPAPELLLMPPARFVGRPYAETLPPLVVAKIDEALAAISDDGTPRQVEYALDLPAGVHHFSASISQLIGGDAAPAGFIVLVRDMTERVRYEERMREAMVVFKASSQGIMTTDADGVISSVNPAFCAITGYAVDEVIGRKSSIFRSGRHDAGFFRAMWARLVETGAWEGEIWNRRRNGETYPQWLTITAVRDTEGRATEYVSLFSDITERKQQEAAMWHQANFDPLTGLANRSLLQDRLERALAQARRQGGKVGLMFLDLDGFKWINDSLGHDVGDELLIDVARRIKACVRDEDTVARLGGDEFTVVVHDLHEQHDLEDLRAISEKLVSALREPFLLGNARHHVSASVGITVFPDDGEDVQTLLRNADIAMYKAKQAGKNRAQFYAHHMQADALARMRLEADLRVAVEQQAFVLHYQPIVDAVSGQLVGAEALIRWHHPQRGMVPPIEFIPVAEDCGLIVPIGEWVLREALRQSRQWRKAGYPVLRLAVNVSGVQFREPGLPELVRELVPESGSEREHVMLEITESVLMDGSEEAEARMREINAHGLGYSLDDFGTGFSSLSYLKRFPVDIVKIDRSFVRDCPDDRNDASLVEAIINMAHSLDLRVTAEGVETVEQREFLRALGCDYLQGYLLGKPAPAHEFEAMMAPLRACADDDAALQVS
ncbi:bifunctional diguanylate cyclase/phosphodiesterase [Aromatoleum diolicum]|nr:EAL domain-containing protein [Aromatoleum diolicum]